MLNTHYRSKDFTITRHTVDTPYPVGPVHLYLFEGRDGPALFDVGPPTLDCYRYLRSNIPLNELKYIFITHSHADHVGALRFVKEISDARVFMPKKDILKKRLHKEIYPFYADFLKSLGFTETIVKALIENMDRYYVEIPKDGIEAVEESSLPEGIKYLDCPGHSITDFVYIVKDEFAITGDFLLKGIFQTPLIDIDPTTMEVFNNYKAYCNSLTKLPLIWDLVILPSHFESEDPRETVSFYVSKIFSRATYTLNCLREGCNVFEAAAKLSNPYEDPFKTFLKASEIVFFKSFIEQPDLLANALKKIGLYDKFDVQFQRFFI